MLDVRDLACWPRPGAPLRGASLRVSQGEMVAVVGPNGAGKTTLCRCLGLLSKPDSGSITVNGRPLVGQPWEAWRSGVMVTLKGKRVFSDLTVMENLFAAPGAWARSGRSHRLHDVLQRFPILADRRSQPAGTLSGGEQQMVALARAVLCSPRLLVLDEPSLGLAPRIVSQTYALLLDLVRDGAAVLVTEENLQRLAPYAHRAYVLVRGRVVAEGPTLDLTRMAASHESFNGAEV